MPDANLDPLVAYLTQTDAVSLTTAAILLIMSVITWSVTLIKAGHDAFQRRAGRRFLRQFWDNAEDRTLDRDRNHPQGRLAQAGLSAARHHARYPGQSDLDGFVSRALNQAIGAEGIALEQGMTVLASIGSTAPFVGLFGTVWSVYHALTALGVSGQPTIDKVAGPVGEALIMTGAGLAVAIPAVVAYNLFARANRLWLAELEAFAYHLHAFLISGAPLNPRPVADGSAAPSPVVTTLRPECG